ncbi:MAG: PAS domain S-box protein [Hyphomicrobiaceae bacterium]|nr:PAS domain S-box protein [Hyphomicrobiaceae bacterium]
MHSAEQKSILPTSDKDDLRDAIGHISQHSNTLSSLQLMIESHLLISVTDRAGKIVHVNDRFCDVSRYTREELVGQTHGIVKSDAHGPAFFEDMWSSISSGKSWTGTIGNLAKDGSPYWVQSTINPIYNTAAEIVGYAAIFTDISSEHARATAEAEKAQRKLKTLEAAFDCLDSSICIFDPDGYMHLANKAQREMYLDSAVHAGDVFDLKEIARRRRPDLSDEEAQEYVEAFLSRDTEEKRRLADGRTIQVSRTVTPDGYVIGLHTDISELVAQTELLASQAAAMNLMKAIATDANESKEADVAYANCLKRICRFTGWEIGHVYFPADDNTDKSDPDGAWYFSDGPRFDSFKSATERALRNPGAGLPQRVFERGEPVWLRDVTSEPNDPRAEAARQLDIVGGCAFPVSAGNKVVAVLEFYASTPIAPNPMLEEVLSHVCTQMGRVAERDQAERQLMKRVAAELKRWDRRLIEQNERFNAALENMSQGLCMFDAEERLIVCNERYSSLYGLTADLIKPGTTLSEIVRHRINNGLYAGGSPEAYIKERRDWAQTKSTERTLHHLSDGRVISVSKRPLPGGGWVSTHEDISDRHKAQKALQQSREMSSKAFRSSPAAMAITDMADGSYLDVNETWATLLGYSHKEAMASSAVKLGIWIDPKARERFLEQVSAVGSVRSFETRFHAKNGDILDVLVSGERLELDGTTRLLASATDITERKRAEKALVESQELFQKAFQLSPVALAISTPSDGSYFDVNDAWMEMFGYSREEAQESTALNLGIWVDPDDRARLRHLLQTSDGSVREFETTQKTKDGRILNVLIYCGYVEVRGEMLLFFAIHDITERKRAERALKDSEQRFKALIETLNVVPWRFDPKQMRFNYVGPQAEEVFGYPVEDWYQPNFWTNSIHPEDREKAVQICADATKRCEDHDFEYRILKADGSSLWVRDVVSVFVENGEVTELRGILIDISDRKRAELALRDSELRFKDIAEISSDWIWECDDELRFTYFSERFFEITGVPTKDLLGKTRNEIGHQGDADWSRHIADLEARRPFRDFRYSIKTQNGRRHWSVSGRPVFDESGMFRGYRGTGADLTSEVEAEQELIRHRDHLQELVNEATAELKARAEELHQALEKEKELNELQRQFVSMASHEFRTPLAIIDSAAQRLHRHADKAEPADVTKRVEKIRNAVGRMTRLMESTLIAARLDAGRPTIQIDNCDISTLIREICSRQQEIAETHQISCETRDLPPTVKADPLALEQVFTNLLSNAVKYSPGSPDIRVTASAEQREIIICVEDQGVGIDEDEIPKMFQRFFRARTSAGIAGTGIGLNLVKTLVELHGGTVEVESRKGEGSHFTVRLPVDGPGATKNGETQAA